MQATLTLGRRSSDRLSSAATVVLAVLVYLAAHVAVRLAMGPTLGLDDAEQALFAQDWAWGYRFRQPPLFTWLLLGLGEFVGVNAVALTLLRYLLLLLTYVCLYLVALRWVADRRLAALAVFSFALIYVFAFYAHHDLTHTTALGAMVAASLYAFARLAERPHAAGRYALLGACFGLGMLAKWNFVMLPAGLLLTCLLLPRFRPLVLTWRTLPAAGAMALVVAPTAVWILAHGQTVGSVSEDILAAEGEAPGFLATLAAGTLALAKSALVFPQPFLPIFLAVFGAALWRAVLRAPAPPPAADG
ncbi:MAG TPA: glycosyltransferase family 39 protein, partial [Geminicoccaceae bacterium]|nr:glycosyltransferase family 39 protein [Geminicoccaceae bacterium]